MRPRIARSSSIALLVVAICVVGTVPVIAKDDLVQHTFRCPQTVEFRVNWQDKISSDPTFTVRKDAENVRYHPSIRDMTRSAQTITCVYAFGSTSAHYDYRVERGIISCKSATSALGGGKQMQCDLKP